MSKQFETENNELLDALHRKGDGKEKESTKRGSKDELVAKIFQCCDEGGVVCEHNTTQLRRMSKKDLQKTLATYIERAMQKQLMAKVNVKRLENATDEQQNQLIALGTLRLMHDSLCVVLEKGVDSIPPTEAPGVASVTRIYNYYKKHGYATIVMGASFRNVGQIKALAGCDNLTIAPALLDELDRDEAELPRILSPDNASGLAPVTMDEATFRWELNADAMATEKLAEGIRKFDVDHKKLIKLVSERLNAA